MERKVVALNEGLRPLTPREWCEASSVGGFYYYGKRGGWCSVCSGESKAEIGRRGSVRCPRCGARLKPYESRKRVERDAYYYEKVCVVDGLQLIRHFRVDRRSERGGESSHMVREAFRTWIAPSGTMVFTARSRLSGMFCDLWRFDSPITLKAETHAYWVGGYTGSRPRLMDAVRRNGLKRLEGMYSTQNQIATILTEPKAETCLKAGQTELWHACLSYRSHSVSRFWPSVRIAIRNGYKVESADIWFDYLTNLESNGKDLRSPYYVCPKNLKEAHQRELEEAERRAEARERAREVALMEENNLLDEEYKEARGKWFGWEVREGSVTLSVLKSVKEFWEEGKEMHHCVYTNKYYDMEEHPSSLIVSARVEGERCETLEIDTDSWKVLQCRGRFNQFTDHHDAIMELMEGHMVELRKFGAMSDLKRANDKVSISVL